MLVLKMVPSEYVQVGPDITVVNSGGNIITIGIEAPKTLSIVRGGTPYRAPQK